jgi:hypothetical protein
MVGLLVGAFFIGRVSPWVTVQEVEAAQVMGQGVVNPGRFRRVWDGAKWTIAVSSAWIYSFYKENKEFARSIAKESREEKAKTNAEVRKAEIEKSKNEGEEYEKSIVRSLEISEKEKSGKIGAKDAGNMKSELCVKRMVSLEKSTNGTRLGGIKEECRGMYGGGMGSATTEEVGKTPPITLSTVVGYHYTSSQCEQSPARIEDEYYYYWGAACKR